VEGYEIHVGKTIYLPDALAFATLNDGERDGCISSDHRVLGTYLHGIFDDDSFRHQFLEAAHRIRGLNSPLTLNPWKAQRKESVDRLAREVSAALDMRRIFSWVGR
jgi:adenosylcobyric acid synthase